jgi:nucleoside-diphosphate-sugar epimerase
MKSALVCGREVLSVPTSPDGFRKRVLGCAAENLGWQPGKGLQEGLKATYFWIGEQVKHQRRGR